MSASAQPSVDVVATVKDWIVETYTADVNQELGEARKPSAEVLNQAVQAVGERLQFPVQVPPGSAPWQQRLDESLREKLANPDSMMLWRSALDNLDQGWTDELQLLDEARQSANLEAYNDKTPEQIYAQRAFKGFEEMWSRVKRETTASVLPQIANGTSNGKGS